jgi:hypothetical protein
MCLAQDNDVVQALAHRRHGAYQAPSVSPGKSAPLIQIKTASANGHYSTGSKTVVYPHVPPEFIGYAEIVR